MSYRTKGEVESDAEPEDGLLTYKIPPARCPFCRQVRTNIYGFFLRRSIVSKWDERKNRVQERCRCCGANWWVLPTENEKVNRWEEET